MRRGVDGKIRIAWSFDDVDTAAVETLGPVLESHERFPSAPISVFMQVVKREHIRLRVYERGAGETRACSGADVRRFAVGIQQGLLAEEVRGTPRRSS